MYLSEESLSHNRLQTDDNMGIVTQKKRLRAKINENIKKSGLYCEEIVDYNIASSSNAIRKQTENEKDLSAINQIGGKRTTFNGNNINENGLIASTETIFMDITHKNSQEHNTTQESLTISKSNSDIFNINLNQNTSPYMILETNQLLNSYSKKVQEKIQKYIPQDTIQINTDNKISEKSFSFMNVNENQENIPVRTPILKFVRSFVYQLTEDEVCMRYNMENYIIEEEFYLNSIRDQFYLRNHRTIVATMRTILGDWIMEVCSQLSFKRATFHSAILLLDVYLSIIKDVRTNQLQLIGVTALIISAKNEVIFLN